MCSMATSRVMIFLAKRFLMEASFDIIPSWLPDWIASLIMSSLFSRIIERTALVVTRISQETFPLATRLSGRVAVRGADDQAEGETEHWYSATGALGGFGNAVVPQLAAAFIRAAEEAREEG